MDIETLKQMISNLDMEHIKIAMQNYLMQMPIELDKMPLWGDMIYVNNFSTAFWGLYWKDPTHFHTAMLVLAKLGKIITGQ